jgi:hypothetical protein
LMRSEHARPAVGENSERRLVRDVSASAVCRHI